MITVAAYAYATAPKETTPATRRMSLLQKATMACFAQIRPALDAGAEPEERLLIAFATRFGEVDATLNVADAILNRTLPVSPVFFQHSVHNAAAGYVSIASGRRDPSITTANGFLSFDLLLYWAAHELAAGLRDRVLLLSAAEHAVSAAAAELPAECEALLLTRSESLAPNRVATLVSIQYAGDPDRYAAALRTLTEGPSHLSTEAESPLAAHPLRLDLAKKGPFHRIMASVAGESVISSFLS